MVRIRIGNDVNIYWTITDKVANQLLSGADIRLYIATHYDKHLVKAWDVEGTTIKFKFEAKDQKKLGVYHLVLVGKSVTLGNYAIDKSDAFELVPISVDVNDNPNESNISSSYVYVKSRVGVNMDWFLLDTQSPLIPRDENVFTALRTLKEIGVQLVPYVKKEYFDEQVDNIEQQIDKAIDGIRQDSMQNLQKLSNEVFRIENEKIPSLQKQIDNYDPSNTKWYGEIQEGFGAITKALGTDAEGNIIFDYSKAVMQPTFVQFLVDKLSEQPAEGETENPTVSAFHEAGFRIESDVLNLFVEKLGYENGVIKNFDKSELVLNDEQAQLLKGLIGYVGKDTEGNPIIENYTQSALALKNNELYLSSDAISFDENGKIKAESTTGLVEVNDLIGEGQGSVFTALFSKLTSGEGDNAIAKKSELATFVSKDENGYIVSGVLMRADQLVLDGDLRLNDFVFVDKDQRIFWLGSPDNKTILLKEDGSGWLASQQIVWDKDGNAIFKGTLNAGLNYSKSKLINDETATNGVYIINPSVDKCSSYTVSSGGYGIEVYLPNAADYIGLSIDFIVPIISRAERGGTLKVIDGETLYSFNGSPILGCFDELPLSNKMNVRSMYLSNGEVHWICTNGLIAESDISFAKLPTLYWGDVKVSDQADSNTNPTVKSITIGNITLSCEDNALKIDGNAFAVGEITALGKGIGEGGTSGVRLLSSLEDVDIIPSSLVNGQALVWSGSKWVAGDAGLDATQIANILQPYALQSWVENKGYLTQHQDISGKQDKITTTNKLPYSLISNVPTSLPASDVYAWAKQSTKPGYSASEVGALSSTHAASGVTTTKISNWDTAYGWGNHASAGYLKSVSWSQISGTTPIWNQNTNGSARYLQCKDTRNTMPAPSYYSPETAVSFDFKGKSVTGLNAAYAGVMTYRPYGSDSDWTGGSAHQLGFDNTYGIYWRTGSSSWGQWSKIALSGEPQPASDVYAWAKAATKPSYTKSEIGLGNVDNTADSAKNVLSATKLTTARTLWGNSFDGSADVSGKINLTMKTSEVSNRSFSCIDFGEIWQEYSWAVKYHAWLSGVDYVTGYGYGNTWVLGTYQSYYGICGFYLGASWDGNNSDIFFKFTRGGNFICPGEITAYSDKRLKSDIKNLDFRGALMPKSFIKDGKQCVGFIAQEVRELYPELVHGEETDDSYLSLNYGAITAVLACQTNDHERRIRELENELERLKSMSVN